MSKRPVSSPRIARDAPLGLHRQLHLDRHPLTVGDRRPHRGGARPRGGPAPAHARGPTRVAGSEPGCAGARRSPRPCAATPRAWAATPCTASRTPANPHGSASPTPAAPPAPAAYVTKPRHAAGRERAAPTAGRNPTAPQADPSWRRTARPATPGAPGHADATTPPGGHAARRAAPKPTLARASRGRPRAPGRVPWRRRRATPERSHR